MDETIAEEGYSPVVCWFEILNAKVGRVKSFEDRGTILEALEPFMTDSEIEYREGKVKSILWMEVKRSWNRALTSSQRKYIFCWRTFCIMGQRVYCVCKLKPWGVRRSESESEEGYRKWDLYLFEDSKRVGMIRPETGRANHEHVEMPLRRYGGQNPNM
jgi:hypothetical protein